MSLAWYESLSQAPFGVYEGQPMWFMQYLVDSHEGQLYLNCKEASWGLEGSTVKMMIPSFPYLNPFSEYPPQLTLLQVRDKIFEV